MKFNENLYQQLKSKRQELGKIKKKLEKLGFDSLADKVDDEMWVVSRMIDDVLLAPIDEV